MSTRQAQPDARTALATRRENGNGNPAIKTLKDEIVKMQAEYQLAMPKGAEATQLIRDALTALRTTKNLEKCERASVLGSLMTCAQLGLRPGVLGHAWLLPFWTSKLYKDDNGRWQGGFKAQLVIGYQGYIELAHRSGKVASLIARVVYENDEFDVDYGLADRLVHKPNMLEDRGKPVAYYAIAKTTNGGHAFIVMSQREMLNYREEYAPRNREKQLFGPWVENFEGMALKTCVRQLAKYMPKSTELAQAIAVDDGVRVDLNPGADAAEVTDFIDGEAVEGPSDGEQWPDTATIPGTDQPGGGA
jgi:recombination protein RecT